jgi:glycosyltransferase involved in cell wall biosynthesis
MINTSVAVVIPCYRVQNQTLIELIKQIGPEVDKIYVVDDCCPEKIGKILEAQCKDLRLKVLYHAVNLGVGAAVITGYKKAVEDGADVIVKIDGDGQMQPKLIPRFIEPILLGEADYVKGNRFFNLEGIITMPTIRILGNAALSFLTKLSSGYWNIFDPTNGFTAIHANVVLNLPLNKISQRYFFETDMLFRLNILKAVVLDVPMNARYMNEVSQLKIRKILIEFLYKHLRNFIKRIFYNYYLRDMSLASIELPLGLLLLIFGLGYGTSQWFYYSGLGLQTPAGTVMLSALPILTGIQFLMAFIGYDISSVPERPIHKNGIRGNS